MRMRRYYTYYYSRKTAFDEGQILGALTPSLRFEVIQHSLKDTIGRIPLFSQILDPLFQIEMFPLFKPVSAAPKEIIFTKGDPSHDLYFLLKGQVEVLSGVNGRVLYRLRQGQHFGESVLTGKRRSATHRAGGACEMFVISSEDLKELFEKRPHEGRLIHAAVMKEHLRKERMRNLSLRLLITGMTSERQELDAAALRLQLAWSSHEHAHERNVFDEEESTMSTDPAIMMPGAITMPTPSLTRDATAARLGETHIDQSTLMSKLAKLDRLEPILDRLDTLTRTIAAASDRSNNKKGGKSAFQS